MDVGVDLTASLSGDSDLVVLRGHLAAQAREGFWLAALQPAAAGKGLGRMDRLRQNDGPMMPGCRSWRIGQLTPVAACVVGVDCPVGAPAARLVETPGPLVGI